MTSTLEIQRRLKARALYSGALDNLIGPMTLAGMDAALDMLDRIDVTAKPAPAAVVPAAWMPDVQMERIICHWTAGGHQANAVDRRAYHILIEGDGELVRGAHSIADNAAPIRGAYAAHTLNCNTSSIGVSLCCMAGAREHPFDAGRAPMTVTQWERLSSVVADLCRRYGIPVTPKTVLSHAEVQANLGIRQRNKWDYSRLAFDPSIKGAKAIGDRLRAEVTAKL